MSFKKMSAALFAFCLISGGVYAAGMTQLTDPQIAHIAYTAGNIDIAAAKLALQKTKNAEVRAFADSMVKDHTAVNKQALALLKKLKVTPQDNSTSQSLTADAKVAHDTLSKLKGTEFDRAYAENEVSYHKKVNGALENTLIPSTTNAELKSLLQTGLKIFQGHEQHAEQLVQSLGKQHASLVKPD